MGIVLKYPSCAGWHGASYSSWLSDGGGFRGDNGVFSFRGSSAWEGVKSCGRGVAVIGTGL